MTIKKFNIRAGTAIFILLCFNCYMNYIEIEALNKRLDDKQLLCKQVHTIKSKHNYVIECSGVLK